MQRIHNASLTRGPHKPTPVLSATRRPLRECRLADHRRREPHLAMLCGTLACRYNANLLTFCGSYVLSSRAAFGPRAAL